MSIFSVRRFFGRPSYLLAVRNSLSHRRLLPIAPTGNHIATFLRTKCSELLSTDISQAVDGEDRCQNSGDCGIPASAMLIRLPRNVDFPRTTTLDARIAEPKKKTLHELGAVISQSLLSWHDRLLHGGELS